MSNIDSHIRVIERALFGINEYLFIKNVGRDDIDFFKVLGAGELIINQVGEAIFNFYIRSRRLDWLVQSDLQFDVLIP